MNRYIIAILLILWPVALVRSQARGNISGKVLDNLTNKPLQLVNVYLENSNYGWATNKDGYYEITNIPYGRYTLIASMMGYKGFKEEIIIEAQDRKNINIRMIEEPILAPEILVQGAIPKEWIRNLTKFKSALLGLSQFRNACLFVNPEVLDFKIEQSKVVNTEHLNANTCAPLIILNNALGYKIIYQIDKFKAGLTNDQLYYIGDSFMAVGDLTMAGRRKIVTLETNDKIEEERWRKNRTIAYKGSMRHFLISLISDNILFDGFEIINPNSGEKINPNSILGKHHISGQYFLNLNDKDLSAVKDGFHGRNVIVVIYKNAPDPVRKTENQISRLLVNDGAILVFNDFGVICSDDFNYVYLDYWKWSFSAAEWLPDDFECDYRLNN